MESEYMYWVESRKNKILTAYPLPPSQSPIFAFAFSLHFLLLKVPRLVRSAYDMSQFLLYQSR